MEPFRAWCSACPLIFPFCMNVDVVSGNSQNCNSKGSYLLKDAAGGCDNIMLLLNTTAPWLRGHRPSIQ